MKINELDENLTLREISKFKDFVLNSHYIMTYIQYLFGIEYDSSKPKMTEEYISFGNSIMDKYYEDCNNWHDMPCSQSDKFYNSNIFDEIKIKDLKKIYTLIKLQNDS